MYSFIYLFSILLSAYYVPGVCSGWKNIAVSKRDQTPAFMEFTFEETVE